MTSFQGDAAFGGEGTLCTNLLPVPDTTPGHCPVAAGYTDEPQFGGEGFLSVEVQPGTGPITSLVYFSVSGDYWSPDDPAYDSGTSTPNVEPVSGLVTFTPRVPRGFQAYLNNYAININSNSIQTVNVMGAITGGTYALEFKGIWTAGISPSATAAELQAALEAISSIGTGNVTVTAVTPSPGYPSYTVEFVNALGNAQQPQMTPDPSLLTVSSGEPAVSVIMLVPGSSARIGNALITFPPRQGRIWTNGQLCSINQADSPNVELLANMPEFDLEFDLIYDVTFTAVSYNDAQRDLAPFAFLAPSDATPICLTDAYLPRLGYQTPVAQSWGPGWTPSIPEGSVAPVIAMPQRDWRKARAG